MTLDKIKEYMQPEIYSYWTVTFFNLTQDNYKLQKEIINTSIKKLELEINSGLLNDVKYHAELELLKHIKGDEKSN